MSHNQLLFCPIFFPCHTTKYYSAQYSFHVTQPNTILPNILSMSHNQLLFCPIFFPCHTTNYYSAQYSFHVTQPNTILPNILSMSHNQLLFCPIFFPCHITIVETMFGGERGVLVAAIWLE